MLHFNRHYTLYVRKNQGLVEMLHTFVSNISMECGEVHYKSENSRKFEYKVHNSSRIMSVRSPDAYFDASSILSCALHRIYLRISV